jgi:hypothetical protein
MHYSKPQGKPRIDASMISNPETTSHFTKSLGDELIAAPPKGDAKQRWVHLRETIHSTALTTFGALIGYDLDGLRALLQGQQHIRFCPGNHRVSACYGQAIEEMSKAIKNLPCGNHLEWMVSRLK